MSNMFDMGMFGMLHPDERKKILEGGSLTTAGGVDSQQDGIGSKIKGWWKDRKTSPKEPGYYEKKQRELEGTYGQVNVGPAQSQTITYDKKKGNIIGAQQGEGYPAGTKIPRKDMLPLYKDKIMQGGTGINQDNTDPRWWHKLANMANVDMDKAMASWKDKGGFEGLMANPAFTMGLAFMQAGAEGKTLGQGALNNVMKAAGVSQHYKKILEDRKLEPIQATGGDISEVKDMLKSINIEEGNWLENFLSGPGAGARYEAAVEEIALEFQKEIRAKQKVLKEAGESQVIRRTDQLKILERLVNSNKIKKKESILSRLGITAKTLQMPVPMAQGGQVAKGQPAIVGEQGPEYFLPKESGKVLSNDDSRIFSMLLAANPQLQNVSRTRSEKILRNRFPEYFE